MAAGACSTTGDDGDPLDEAESTTSTVEFTTTAAANQDQGEGHGEGDGWPETPSELPELLTPVELASSPEADLEDLPVQNGVIVTNSAGRWTAYDEQLGQMWQRTVSIEPTGEHDEPHRLAAPQPLPWPGLVRYWSDSGLHLLDTVTGRELDVPASGHLAPPPHAVGSVGHVALTLPAYEVRDPGPGNHLIDLRELKLASVGGEVATYGAVSISPSADAYVIDAESGERGPVTLVVGPTAAPDERSWEYRAPAGLAFASSGSFLEDGSLELLLRASSSPRTYSYVGSVGEPLRLESTAETVARRYPGVPVVWDGDGPAVQLTDGSRYRFGPGAPYALACGQHGWRAAMGDEVIVDFGPDFQQATEHDWSGGRVTELRPSRWADVLISASDGVQGLLDCEEFGVFTFDGFAENLSTTEQDLVLVQAYGRPDHLVWASTDDLVWTDGYDWIYSAAVSPDETRIALVAERGGEIRLSVLDADDGAELASIGLPEPRSASWLQG